MQSTFRPCRLNRHYELYGEGDSYDENEAAKVAKALEIVEYYPEDKFLIFAHTKKTGELMKKALQTAGVQCEFHNADLSKDKRIKLEQQFKTDPKFQVIVATSTLAWGLNMPARRVVILGVHRGLSDVATYDIWQMMGRSGRPGYDPVGDAYVLLPQKTFEVHKERLKRPDPIQSQMLDNIGGRHKVLAFHLVSEIYQENIKDDDDVKHWYKRSLAAFQAWDLDEKIVEDTMTLLKKCGAIWEEDGRYTVTSVGKISSLFYYSPFDVADLKRNFNYLFDNHKEEDDICLSVALGNVDTQRCGIVSRAERDQMSGFASLVDRIYGRGVIQESAIKAAYGYHLSLNGRNDAIFAGFVRGLQFDFMRLIQVLHALDSFTGKWGRKGWLHKLGLRVLYGVKGDLVHLCEIPQIGRVRANKLWSAGLRTVEAIANNPSKVRACLGVKTDLLNEIVSGAKALFLTSS